MNRTTTTSACLALFLSQSLAAYQMGDTATALHEYELLTFYRSGPDAGLYCHQTGTSFSLPDGMVVNTDRTSGTIEFDSYQGDDATVSALGSVAVGDGDGRYFGHVGGSNTTVIWDNTPTSSTRSEYIKSFRGLLITGAEPQLRGVYSQTTNQDWSRIPLLTVDDEGHLTCVYNVRYSATLHNGDVPDKTLLNLLYDIEDMSAGMGLEALTIGASTNATLGATRAAAAVPSSTAPDEYPVVYRGVELVTDPGGTGAAASVSFSGFPMPEEELLLLPVYFSGALDENAISVAFAGTELETIAHLDKVGRIRVIGFDPGGAQGQSGQLTVTLNNSGASPSSLLLVQEIQDLPARPEPASKGGGSGSSMLFLVMIGGFLRRYLSG